MVDRIKFPFRHNAAAAATLAWPWPACLHRPQTPSFREETPGAINSASDSESESLFDPSPHVDESAVVRGLRSDRLIFDPGETNSIMEEPNIKQSAAALMEIDSRDPFYDFRASMGEMVEAHGLEDWDCLEELLACFLRVNPKCNHVYIVEAFVDLVLHLAQQHPSSYSAMDEHCSSSSIAAPFASQLSFSSSTNSSISQFFSGVDTCNVGNG